MTRRPDEHMLAVEEERLSPVVIVVTVLLIVLFILAILYRIGIALV